MTESDLSVFGTGQFRLHYTNTNDAAQALLGPAYDFGNEVKITANGEAEHSKIVRHSRGANRRVGNPVTSYKLSYDIEVNQLTFNALARAMFIKPSVGADNARASGDDVAVIDLDFRTAQGKSLVQDRWYDLSTSALRYLHLTSATITGVLLVYGAAGDSTTLLEGKDYELDKTMGAVRFLRSVDDLLSATVDYPAIAAGDGLYSRIQVPLESNKLTGIGVVDVFDDSGKLIWQHKGFGCDVIPNGDIEFNSELSTVKLRVNASLPTGELLVERD